MSLRFRRSVPKNCRGPLPPSPLSADGEGGDPFAGAVPPRPPSPGRNGGFSCSRQFGKLFLLAFLLAAPAFGYETDQYHDREVPLADSTAVLDRRVNAALAEIAAEWRGPRDERKFARAIYWKLGGPHWVDHIERFSMRSPEVARLPRGRSIYAFPPLFTSPVLFFFGVGERLKLADVLIGSDKLGHFFSQGYKYFRRLRRGWSEERFVTWGGRVEGWLFGQYTTRVFSNADMVANYEGLLFYRGLFEDGVLPGKGPIVAFEGGRARILRPFTFRDHVNDYWDEALNPSLFGAALGRHVLRQLDELCPFYAGHPSLFVPAREEELALRYAHIGMKDARYNRLDRFCAGRDAGPPSPQPRESPR